MQCPAPFSGGGVSFCLCSHPSYASNQPTTTVGSDEHDHDFIECLTVQTPLSFSTPPFVPEGFIASVCDLHVFLLGYRLPSPLPADCWAVFSTPKGHTPEPFQQLQQDIHLCLLPLRVTPLRRFPFVLGQSCFLSSGRFFSLTDVGTSQVAHNTESIFKILFCYRFAYN